MTANGFTSPFFTLVRLGSNVFAAIANRGTGALGNAGIIDLGGQTIVFDTFLSPAAARDLRRAAQTVTGGDVTHVVNSHWHGDHINGNTVFSDAMIVSTSGTRERMLEVSRSSDVEQTIQGLLSYLKKRQQEHDELPPGKHRDAVEADIGDRRSLLDSIREVRNILPNVTFTDQLGLYGSSRSAVLHTFGGAHTHSDAFLWVPEEQVLFCGDIFVNRTHPWVGHGHIDNWIRTIDRISEFDVVQLVPGHGDVGNKDDLYAHREYLVHLLSLIDEVDKQDITIPEQYADWSAAHMFYRNIDALRSRK